MEPTGSGSGAAEPVEDDRIQEPDHRDSNASSNGDGAPTAAAPLPPLHLEQAAGSGDGSTSAAVVDPRKGKETAPPLPPRVIPSSPSSAGSSGSSSTRSPDYAAAFRDGVAESSAAAAARLRRVTWSDPVVEGTTEVPNAPLDPNLVTRQRFIERLIQAQVAADKDLVLDQTVLERLIQEQAADEDAKRRREQQLRAEEAMYMKEEAMYMKEQEKLSPVQVGVKVRTKRVKGKSFWSRFKNKIFRREGREICSEHVKYQTHPITEVRRYHRLASDEANHLDAYSECRSVIGDGECFYRSFIFSYLEQVVDRQDTHEEHRLLHVVKILSTQHANLRWNSEFSRSSRAFKNLIKKVKRWKRHGRWNSRESTSRYRKEKLLEFFSKYDTTQDIFIFLRLVVAIHICSHREVYEPLIPGLRGNYSLEDWCIRRVTPARRFTDHVMMLALATALEVPLRVERVRGGYDPDIYTGTGVPHLRVILLYSGDHFEIIYPRAPPAESSSHQASQREDPADQSSSHQASQRDPGDQS